MRKFIRDLVIGVIGTTIGAIVGVWAAQYFQIWDGDRCVEPLCRLQITQPLEDALVGPYALISGRTPHRDLTHHLVVTPIATRQAYIQEPLQVDRGGTWFGVAVIGEGKLGCGQAFALFVMATKEHLSPGPVDALPADAQVSPQISVTRSKAC